jgi:hypothetical protein
VQQLRKLCALRTATVCFCLAQQADNGFVRHDTRGYQLKGPLQSLAVSLRWFNASGICKLKRRLKSGDRRVRAWRRVLVLAPGVP